MLDLFDKLKPNEKTNLIIKVDKTAQTRDESKGLFLWLETTTEKIDLSTYIIEQYTYDAHFQYPVNTPFIIKKTAIPKE